METLWQDMSYGMRMLWKSRGFTFVAVLTLALGIGANSAIFSALDAALFRPLPYEKPDRIVMIWESFPQQGVKKFGMGYADVADWKNQNHVFDQIAVFQASTITGFNLTGGAMPERIQGALTSADFFQVLKANPILGRTLLPEDEQAGHERVVVISQGLWQRYFGGDPNAIGKPLRLNEIDYTVIGVMPSSFRFPSGLEMPPGAQFNSPTELWAPLVLNAKALSNRLFRNLRATARLKDGVSLQQAQAEMAAIGRRLAEQYPDTNQGSELTVVTLKENQVGELRPALLILLGATGFVLLIACANVANLLLARATVRQREIALRAALGASRLRIVRQLLTESVILSLIGGALGLVLAIWGNALLVAFSPANLPRINEMVVDKRVFIFNLLISLLTGILFGLAPALQTSRPDLNESLKEGGRGSAGSGRRYTRSLLVVSEVALAMVLLICAGLLLKSFFRLTNVNPGFNPEQVLTMRVTLPGAKYPNRKPFGFYRQLLDKLKPLPGVQYAAAIRDLPLSGTDPRYGFNIEGSPKSSEQDAVTYRYRAVSPDYFRAMNIPLIKGRDFTPQDNEDGPAAVIINETIAKTYFPGEDPIGRVMLPGSNAAQPKCIVVGVVGDVKFGGLDSSAEPELYFSYLQIPDESILSAIGSMAIVIRASTDPVGLIGAVRQEIGSADKDVPVSNIKTMADMLSDSIAPKRFQMLLLSIFACIALLLAAGGLYGVIAYTVMQSTREIGVRIALGAMPIDILRLVIGQAMGPTLVGLAIGTIMAVGLTRIMSSLLYGVSTTDPATFAIISVMLASAALLASYIPARRATKIDPMTALRYE